MDRQKYYSRNMVTGDTGFECGVDNWYSNTMYNPEHVCEGRRSGSFCMKNDRELAGRSYNTVCLYPGKSYVLSCYAKGEPGAELRLSGIEYWVPLGSGTFKLTENWERYFIKFQPSREIRHLRLYMYANGKETYVDDCQLEEGEEPTEYTPSEPISVCVSTGVPSELVVPEKDGKCRVKTRFYNAANLSGVTAEIEIRRFPDKQPIYLKKMPLEFDENGHYEYIIDKEELSEAGYYPIIVRAFDAEGNVLLNREQPIVVAKALDEDFDRDFFGILAHYSNEETLKRMGIGWVKYGGGSWTHIEPEKGNFRPVSVNNWKDRGMKQLTPLYGIASPPAWTTKTESGLPCNGEEIREFAEYLVQATKHTTDLYEFESELNLVLANAHNVPGSVAAACYNEMCRVVGEVVHKHGKKMLFDVSSCSSDAMSMAEMIMRESKDELDVFAPHLYGWNRYIGERVRCSSPEEQDLAGQLTQCQKLIERCGADMELAIGEYGYALDQHVAYDSIYAGLHAAYLARSYMMAKTVPQMKRLHYFIDYYQPETPYDYGMWRDNRRPLPTVAAFTVCARMIGGSECVVRQDGPEVYILEFRHKDKTVFAVYNANPDKEHSSVTVKLAVSDVQASSMTGSDIPCVNGTLEFELSPYPVYIETTLERSDELFGVLADALVALQPYTLEIARNSQQQIAVKVIPAATVREKMVENVCFRIGHECCERTVEVLPDTESSFTIDFVEEIPLTKISVDVEFKNENRNYMQLLPAPILCQYTEIEDWKTYDFSNSENLIVMDGIENLAPPDPNTGWNGPENLSVKLFTAWDSQNFYMMADVRDDIHCQPYNDQTIWAGDGIQMGLDMGNDAGKGFLDRVNDFEFGLALHESGPVLWAWHAPYGRPDERVNYPLQITREGDITQYRLVLPWEAITDKAPEEGDIIGFSVTVNDNDGVGVRYNMHTDMGLKGDKRPNLFSKLVFAK